MRRFLKQCLRVSSQALIPNTEAVAMSRMRRLKWRRVVGLVDVVWGTGGAVRREVLGVRQKLWVGMQGEVGGDFDSLDVGCIEPLRMV